MKTLMKILIRILSILFFCYNITYGQSLQTQISSYNAGINSSITNSDTHSQQITHTVVGNAFTNLSGIMKNMYDSLLTRDSLSTIRVSTIAKLESYSGFVNLIFVTDSLRGGWFNKVAVGIPDSGICFPSTDGNYWMRVYSGDILATWYGAIGDSATDNTVAFREWLSSPYSAKSYCRLPKGNYLVSDTILIPNQIRLNGSAGYAPYSGTVGTNPVGQFVSGSSVIIQTADKNLFRITANGVFVDGLTIKSMSTFLSGVALVVDSGYEFKLHHTFIQGFYDQCNIGGGTEITIGENLFVNPAHRYINWYSYITDEGDNLVQGNWFENITSVDTGIYIHSGFPGFRFFDNKMHIPPGQTTGNYLSVDICARASTNSSGGVNISRNSLEAYSNCGALVIADTGHTITGLFIQNNNTANNTGGFMHEITVYSAVPNQITNANILGNEIYTQGPSGAPIYLNGVKGYTLENNQYANYFSQHYIDSTPNCSYRNYPTLYGDVMGTPSYNTVNSITALNGVPAIKRMPNIITYQVSGLTTGSIIFHTRLTRLSHKLFAFHVTGTSNTTAQPTDFTLYGFINDAANGNIDGQPGAISRQSMMDNGSDGYSKYIGIDSLGNVAFALGDTNTISSTESFCVEYYSLLSGDTVGTSGWFTTLSTKTNFNWKDNESISSFKPAFRGTANGTTNTVAMFTAANTLGNSPITVSGNNITAPSNLTVNGTSILHTTTSTNTSDSILGKNSLNQTVSIPANRFSGAGSISSVTNSDGSLTFSNSSGAVTGSLNSAHANAWTVPQTFNASVITPTISSINGDINTTTTEGSAAFGGSANTMLDSTQIYMWSDTGNNLATTRAGNYNFGYNGNYIQHGWSNYTFGGDVTMPNRILGNNNLQFIMGYDNTIDSSIASFDFSMHSYIYHGDHCGIWGSSFDTIGVDGRGYHYTSSKSTIANSQFCKLAGSLCGIYSGYQSLIDSVDYAHNFGGVFDTIITGANYAVTVGGYGGRTKGLASSILGGYNIDMLNAPFSVNYSTSLGGFNNVMGGLRNTQYALMGGRNTYSNGDYSLTFGYNDTTNGQNAVAIGDLSKALASGAWALSDASGTGYTNNIGNSFGAYFTNGYNFTGGAVSATEYLGTSQKLSGNDTASNLVLTGQTSGSGVLYTDGNGKVNNSGNGSNGQVLQMVSGHPSWQTFTSPLVVSTNDVTTTSATTLGTYNTSSLDAIFEVGGYVNIISNSGSGRVILTVTYTDENGNSQTQTFSTGMTAGTSSASAPQVLRVKANTTITIVTTTTGGTFTGTYDAGYYLTTL